MLAFAQAKALWRLSEMGLDYVRTTVAETRMPGVDLTEGGWLKVSKTGEIDDDIAEVRLIGQEFGAPVEGWPAGARARGAPQPQLFPRRVLPARRSPFTR